MSYTAPGTKTVPTSRQTVVLYDRRSGEIVHMHEALFFSEGRSREARESMLTDLVRGLAKEMNPTLDVASYEVLHAPDFEMAQAEYRVDVARKQLVAAASS
jgi:hypothetical protein